MQVLKQEIDEKIRQNASGIFLENGFEKTSMRKIASETGISVSNLYNYFESKTALFYAISDPAYSKVKNLLSTLFKKEENENFNDESFIEDFIALTASKIGDLIKTDRDALLLLMDAGTGTKYEKFKDKIVSIIEDHFRHHLKENSAIEGFMMHIVATNLIESILEIARHYRNDRFVDDNMIMLMKYHVKGIRQFF